MIAASATGCASARMKRVTPTASPESSGVMKRL
jgi:hypothetical protein